MERIEPQRHQLYNWFRTKSFASPHQLWGLFEIRKRNVALGGFEQAFRAFSWTMVLMATLGTSLLEFWEVCLWESRCLWSFLFVYVSASRHGWFDVIFSGVFEEYGMPGLRRKLDAHLLRTQRLGLNTINAEMFLSVWRMKIWKKKINMTLDFFIYFFLAYQFKILKC